VNERGLAPRRRQRRIALRIGLAAILALAAAVALETSTAGAAGSLTIADVAPFTGPDAEIGTGILVGCAAAAHAIDGAGGILGSDVSCKAVDTRGDPADAVPAVRQLYASTSNLPLIVGCTSDEAASVVPIFEAEKTVAFCMTGQSEFDHVKFSYFYRLVPPDLSESYAMVAIAKYMLHYKRIALAFGNDIGSQTFVQPAVQAIHKGGLTLAANETLDLSATTFRTEAAAVVNSHPDVILTEALGSTDATFLSEVKQLNGGKMIPVIGTSATIAPAWFKAVAAAVGASTIAKDYWADNLVIATSGPAYQAFSKAMYAVKGTVGQSGQFSTYLTFPGAVHIYDGVTLAALAMIESKSTTGSVYKGDIEKIGDGVPGAVTVSSFAQGVAELKAGKQIRYIGPGGPTNFDAYHDSAGIFQVDRYTTSGAVTVAAGLPTSEMRALGL
jgi:ABC-type branched-subunit amino acid transport system substrate-binding protein